jgi:hypothetical protein
MTIYLVYRGAYVVRICARREDAEAFAAHFNDAAVVSWGMVLADD